MRISDWSSDVCSSDLIEQPHARRAAADDAQRIERHPDQLGLVGDEHELVALRRREAGDDGAVAAAVVDLGDALAAAPGAAIFVRRGELAIDICADGAGERPADRQPGDAFSAETRRAGKGSWS